MKVCKHKLTGRILETQYGEDAEVLLRNNLQYYLENELVIVDMTREEITQAIKKQNEIDMAPQKQAQIDALKTMTIEQKVNFLLERQGLKITQEK